MTGPTPPSISVVINTLNRAPLLSRTLDSLSRIAYGGPFEVVIVNGPSTDSTEEVIAHAGAAVRFASTSHANLSISRNVGIATARGDIVAFLDDDAVPEPAWLTQIAASYGDDAVGAAGGFVFDHTGYSYQYRFATVNRLGVADLSPDRAQPELCFPGSFAFPHLLGANSSFRRSALLEIGGFDEEFEYYLDETDVHVRLIDAGYVIAQNPLAVVHHGYAPSNVRGTNRVAKDRYSILKNKLYFSLLHARPYFSMDELFAEHHRFVEQQRAELRWAVAEGLLADEDLARFEADVDRATETGLANGLRGRQPVSIAFEPTDDLEIRQYPTIKSSRRRNVVLVSQDLPPATHGGVGRFVRDMSQELASLGDEVHVVTRSRTHSRVDYDKGVWIHWLETPELEVPIGVNVPANLWSWSEAARREVARIDASSPVDVVEAPIWDVQSVAFLGEKWPLVTSLQTTLMTWLETHEHLAADPAWMAAFGTPVLAMEKKVMERSDAVRAISQAILDDVEIKYGITFAPGQAVVAHLGVADPVVGDDGRGHGRISPDPKHVSFLFVGRLEERKGVDVLLEAFELAHSIAPNITLNLVGDDSLALSGGTTYRSAWEAREMSAQLRDSVRFLGAVTDHQLDLSYENSDVLVAPSRYESFGLIFVEGMAHSLPVIGTVAGGIPEVVHNGTDGILVAPADANALAKAIVDLATNSKKRQRLGNHGRRSYEKHFTARAMAVRSTPVFDAAVRRASQRVGQ